MIKSMTGYGKASYTFANHITVVEIKSVNSKQLDLNWKMPSCYKEKENEMRVFLTPLLERGKVDISIDRQVADAAVSDKDGSFGSFAPINQEAYTYYYQSLKAMGADDTGLAAAIIRIPGVIAAPSTEQRLSEEEWQCLQQALKQAVEDYNAFRVQEGAALEKMFSDKLDGIKDLLQAVEPYEKGRVARIRQRLLDQLAQLAQQTRQEVDQNRLEAELIYYLEKLDITEEKVRLDNHIRYFRQVMAEDGAGVGKKLGFIAQEMGREINTLGSKANQSEMQILVVKMKDLLEQIKEQVLNVL